MGYGMQFPANQVGGRLRPWDLRGYGLPEVWVKRGPTVYRPIGLKSPRESEIQFSHFIRLLNPPGVLRDLIY